MPTITSTASAARAAPDGREPPYTIVSRADAKYIDAVTSLLKKDIPYEGPNLADFVPESGDDADERPRRGSEGRGRRGERRDGQRSKERTNVRSGRDARRASRLPRIGTVTRHSPHGRLVPRVPKGRLPQRLPHRHRDMLRAATMAPASRGLATICRAS